MYVLINYILVFNVSADININNIYNIIINFNLNNVNNGNDDQGARDTDVSSSGMYVSLFLFYYYTNISLR
jgi:hypothetical protein